MALDAFSAPFMPLVFDAHKFAASTIGIIEPGVTPETELSRRIERQKLFVIRMVDGWTVTVFTFDRLMARRIKLQYVIFVTFNTGFPSAVLNGEVLPFLNITQPMVAVSEVPSMNAEVVGHEKLSGYEYQTDQADCNPQWAQDMPLHHHLPRRSERTDKVYELTAAVAM